MAVIGQKLQTMYHQIVVSWELLPVRLQNEISLKDNDIARRSYIIARSEIKKTFSK
jgi:hypothetical protein